MTERKQKLDAQLCKHSYDEATERVSRLASYATSRSLKKIGFGDYYSLAEELCKKDIIVLSISIRRLAEMTKSATHLKELKVRSFNTDNEKNHTETQESCWNIIGNILHGVEIDVMKDVGKYTSADIFDAMNNYEEIDAALSIKSDKFHKKTFSAVEFLICINTFLDGAEDILSKNRIFVGSLYE
ncbi:MAG: hypothetical protein K0M55_06305 [Rhizobium sp.]|nr:hypothetical protein [Rhizobium sp.]